MVKVSKNSARRIILGLNSLYCERQHFLLFACSCHMTTNKRGGRKLPLKRKEPLPRSEEEDDDGSGSQKKARRNDDNKPSPQNQTVEEDDDESVANSIDMNDYEEKNMPWVDFITMLFKRLVGPDRKVFVRALKRCENNERPITDLLMILDFACRNTQEHDMLYCHLPEKSEKEAVEDDKFNEEMERGLDEEEMAEEDKFNAGGGRKKCSAEGCNKFALGGGVCRRHGAPLKQCSVNRCNKIAQVGGVCRRHGAPPNQCSAEGCNNNVVKGGVCRRHGAPPKKCSAEGCKNNVVKGGVCKRHGAPRPRAPPKKCTAEGCNNQATRAGGVCRQHCAKK